MKKDSPEGLSFFVSERDYCEQKFCSYFFTGRCSFIMTYYANCVILNVFISPLDGSWFGFVAAQAMNSNGGNEREYFTQGEADSRGFKGKYDEKSNHLRNF